jgi:hypothetical protein
VFKKKYILAVAVALTSLSATANNPFEKPVMAKNKTDNDLSSVNINVINDVLGGTQHQAVPLHRERNQYIDMGLVYRGTTNGVDIYFDPDTKRYVRDDSKIVKIKDLTTKLPPMKEVNY